MVILGVDGGERVAAFQAALAGAGAAPAAVLDYRAFVAEPGCLPALFDGATGVRRRLMRFDSPGGDFSVWRALANFGADAMGSLPGAVVLDEAALDSLSLETGLLTASRQHHLGFVAALRLASSLVPEGVRLLNDVDAVELYYDKAACHAFMERSGFPVPRGLGPVTSFAGLAEAMKAARIERAFVKPRHGSGAAGVAAVAVSRFGVRAWSSAELARRNGQPCLYNTRRLRQYEGAKAMALVDAVCALDAPLGAHAEQWVPKASLDDHVCDLRILVIDGEPAHTVLRMSRAPVTNLHLGNRRETGGMLRAKTPPAVWEALMNDCRRFAALFPKALQVSLDAAVTVNLRRHVFFEANAFGDLLRGITHNRQDPYAAQIAALGLRGALP